ncbi:ATP-citrate synthase [Wallemia mellicola CBS 633.66]|uniref:ATP-citrate synthase n=2 Tax=Wallemia mellicola TaxID=1708541 RepID=A0A4T0P3N0_9BASI|nr:ATP-citrate synthase [Wallemia mellicola CBS 633.66]TIC01219.1 ATP-citrate synthase [Wallemia mellicola]EIM23517.1 ATP-citrate synthase [Wallemia mellicola CBS 633.66]TIC04711.1 ATP-citrate synthase [Wallemia mellicola]TIC32710.1 ATP-citrate synthase [Wallemia mellicola]TIC75592.1 ATP-citrate synthase [Wallemia mellicola]|eukprot:XP_006956194.1 ATP-citrate synthase [Wallemia mellicola CBS 633.66]
MSSASISEYDGKRIVSYWLPRSPSVSEDIKPSKDFVFPDANVAQIKWDSASNTITPDSQLPGWVFTEKLVVKPDQLIKRRGKAGLLGINKTWSEGGKQWIVERAGKQQQVQSVTGTLNNFIAEPFVPHPQKDEYYVCIHSTREGDNILFTNEGGVDVGDVDAKAQKITIAPVDGKFPTREELKSGLVKDVEASKQDVLIEFLERLYAVYVDLHFAYLEINPLVCLDATPTSPPTMHFLDLAAKIDQTADYICGPKWSIARDDTPPSQAVSSDRGPPMVWPAPFGRDSTKEEAYIKKLDGSTGASLKLTVLKPEGRIWTMVAGGGASVVYSDAIAAAGFAHELANYGEYSGAPTQGQTYEYAKTIIDLITRGEPHPEGKLLIIGGGIANFTNVAATFKGIIQALKEFQQPLQKHNVKIYVRRAGPNYQEGLKAMRLLGESLGVDINVYGPETHITAIVPLALGLTKTTAQIQPTTATAASIKAKGASSEPANAVNAAPSVGSVDVASGERTQPKDAIVTFDTSKEVGKRPDFRPFDENTRCLVFGLQPRAIQGMLDFDYSCGRKTPSVAAMIYPFGGHHIQKFYWGTKETLLPVYTSVEEAIAKHPDADCVVNFASSRSVFDSVMEILDFPQIKSIAIIAEGVPERFAREILVKAEKKGTLIIGPATVGGIKPGCFRIGNSGGMMDNILSSKLYRSGSVGYVSKSGGMSNELNNILSIVTDGTYEGIAIGGDRYPGSTFIDHLLRYEADPNCKLLMLLGEVGGVEEYRVIDAVKKGIIKKPIVAWSIGTCAKMFSTEVQFGHAGSMANSDSETADAKNTAMRNAGFIVPETFEELPDVLRAAYEDLVAKGQITPKSEPQPPTIPMDYKWAQELGMIRKPAAFISTISDERGQELLYNGMKISDVFKEEIGIGGVMSLLWFKRRLPDYACKFLEIALQLTADHGPAVSGAMNTIVTARAGKDLISALCSGLLTIGDRFGGALDGAATEFTRGVESGLSPREFVDSMRKANRLIPGIGHKIKSKTNPDLRVELVKDFVIKNFPSHATMDYALGVENVTSSKKDSLILNVDGCIAAAFCDLLKCSGAFNEEEARDYMKIGTLNGLFVLGRTIGFIGHFLDQKRLRQPLYRHPADDIFIDLNRVEVAPKN